MASNSDKRQDGGTERMRLCADTEPDREADLRFPNSQPSTSNSYKMSSDKDVDSENCCTAFCEQVRGDNPVTKYCTNFWTLQNLKKKFPIVTWAPKYRLKHFVGDLVAGLTVGLTVLPQGLAYAVVADLPPQYGLYASFMGVFMYMFFGTSKDITLGPTAIMSLMVAEFGAEKAPNKDLAPVYAVILSLVVGLIQIAMGLLNLGFIIQFISFPVISGFTSAAAIIIAFSQLKKIFGLKDIPRDFIPQLRLTFERLPQANWADFGMGICCIAILTCMKYLKQYLVDPRMKREKQKVKKALWKILWLICTARNAVIVILAAGIAAILKDLYGIDRLSLTGDITEGIPAPAAPQFELINVTNTHVEPHENVTKYAGDILGDIGEGFFVVALIGLLESIAIAKAFARRNEYAVDSSQELIALGIANFVSSFFHSYPVTGSFSRTAINSQSGVRTPAGGLWTGVLVLIALAVLTPYFYYIPQSALAAMIICAVVQMVEYEEVPHFWRVKKLDLLPLAITFFVCIFVNIEYGILAGVGFSILILIYPMARPELNIRYENWSGGSKLGDNEEIQQSKEAIIIEPNQGLKFPAAEYIKDKVMKYGVYETPCKAVVLNALHIAGTDFTVVQGITQLAEYFEKHKLKFVIATCNEEFKTILDNAEIKQLRIADTVPDALELVFGSHGTPLTDSMNISTIGNINNGFDDSEFKPPSGDENV